MKNSVLYLILGFTSFLLSFGVNSTSTKIILWILAIWLFYLGRDLFIIDNSVDTSKTIEEINEESNEIINTKEKELNSLISEINNYSKKKDELFNFNNELQNEKEKLITSITDLEKKKNELQTNISCLENVQNNLTKDIQELKADKVILEDEISERNNYLSAMPKIDKANIDYIDNLSDGYAFEKYCGKLLTKLGFHDVEVTSQSKDYGIDVIATNSDDIKFGFQCKLYSSPVGISAVQEAISGKTHWDCAVTVVVTNNFFTPEAKTLAKENKVLLWDRKKLIEKLKEAEDFIDISF